jgi:3-deoxy-D-manno-octulosonic-acid transferase
MPNLLDAVYLLALLVASPVLVRRMIRDGKYREGFRQKFQGRLPRRTGAAPCAWFHAVSVGEVLLLRGLISRFRLRHPDWEVVVTSTTRAGLEVARKSYPDLVTCYAPLDFSWPTRNAVARLRPRLLVLAELELWPNLIAAARNLGARVAIVNGRLSDRSARGYARLRPFLLPTLHGLDRVAVQSETYARRFAEIGVPPDRIATTGSIKYDNLETDRDNPRTTALRRDLGLAPADLVFVAGSTMEGEEPAVLDAYERARIHHRSLRLVLVPRHPERFERVARMIEDRGLPLVRRGHPERPAPEGDANPVVLIDTLGELSAVWGLADVAFVGGSLLPGRGGQNMMEPAAFGASVLFGPHTHNFKEAVEGLLACHGARRVGSGAELTRCLIADLTDPETAAQRGEAARRFVLAQQGAADRTLAELERLLGPPILPYPQPRNRARTLSAKPA